uniref:Uncharacterized protein n=1 Tax=Clytia hemisphaerica TaxID=252671 RepID=A0A7M5WTS1_9CNID
MGNEASAIQYRDADEKPKKGRVLRTSSLKATQRPNYPSMREKKDPQAKTGNTPNDAGGPKKSKFSLKRSNTFTSINTFSRPSLFQSKLFTNDNQTANIGNKLPVGKLRIEKLTEEGDHDSLSSSTDDVTNDAIKRHSNSDDKEQGIKDEITKDQEDLFVPRREEVTNQSIEIISQRKDITTSQERVTVEKNSRDVSKTKKMSHVTLAMNRPDNVLNKSNTITIGQQLKSSVVISSTKTTSVDSLRSIDSSEEGEKTKEIVTEDTISNHSFIFEENFEMNMEKLLTPETSEGEDESRKAHSTPAERRRKNVLRSQSMNYHMTRPRVSLVSHQRSTSIDDGIDGGIKDDTSLSPVESSNSPKLGGRRSSDTSLLKEQHLKRSQQFTQMLKQYRLQHDKTSKLSSYGLGVIKESMQKETVTETRSTKLRRHNDYIDSWLKDQSDRINNLSAAAKGDADKIRSLRASFRERSLKTPQKDLLPKRASSVKLPRRNQNLVNASTTFISSSDSEDLEDMNGNTQRLVDKNGNFICKRPTRNPLKKQLTDTLLLVDKSFKNSTLTESGCLHHPIPGSGSPKTNGSIKFCSTPTSAVLGSTATNIAVVKPIQREDNIVHVNTVHRLEDQPTASIKQSHNAEYRDPLGEQLSDKDLIRREEKVAQRRRQQKMFVRSSSFDNKPLVHNIQHTPLMRTRSDSVDPISESLDKVMGDLKSLRSQDMDLAQKLLGLGRSIKDFKSEQDLNEPPSSGTTTGTEESENLI